MRRAGEPLLVEEPGAQAAAGGVRWDVIAGGGEVFKVHLDLGVQAFGGNESSFAAECTLQDGDAQGRPF